MPDVASIIPAKILVPIDFSPSSHHALDAAAELAQKFGAELYVLHVIPKYAAVALPEGVSDETIVDQAKKTAVKNFELTEKSLKSKGVKATTNTEVGADVAATILDVIERENANLVVFTTHGLSGWYPQVFGSIAEKLVRLSTCPVLLLRTPEPESSAVVPFEYSSRSMEWW
jgi:nucleotide-binding universal stress UspA family protein